MIQPHHLKIPLRVFGSLPKSFMWACFLPTKMNFKLLLNTITSRGTNTFCVKESDPACWSVRCKHCSWHLRACFRATHGLFEVRKYNGPHTCTESTLTQDHEQLDTHVIEKELRDVVKNDPTIKISSLQRTLYNKYPYRPSYFKVWEAKEKAIGREFGD